MNQIINCNKDEYIYLKLKLENNMVVVFPLYYIGGTHDYDFHQQKIRCYGSWYPHTIYTSVFEESSYGEWMYRCCKCNKIVELRHGGIRTIASYANKVLIHFKGSMYPKEQLRKEELSIGKSKFVSRNTWVKLVRLLNNELLGRVTRIV